jgi:rhodanese-related sulfurtransferase
LVKAGFTNVATLAGGLNAWKQADLPLAKGKR